MTKSFVPSGRHYLQVPGPTPVPERIIQAMCKQIIDHRSSEFAEFAGRLFRNMSLIFKTKNPVMIFASSGTGAWESALVNTLSRGDQILIIETGHFGFLWSRMATNLGLEVTVIANDWRSGPDVSRIEEELCRDSEHRIKAICIVHNETSTGVRTSIPMIRRALDIACHPALLMVDAVSSLAAMEFEHDEWGIDISISGSQKGLMLPPGLAFVAVSDKAIAATKNSQLPRFYWSWTTMLAANADGFFPCTPATGLLYGLSESLLMLNEEGLQTRFTRHERHSAMVRQAVAGWGLNNWCRDERSFSPAVTAVEMPEGHNAEQFRDAVRRRFDLSLAMGLGKTNGNVFRIGHLGFTNETTILGAIAAIEVALSKCRIPHIPHGIEGAIRYLKEEIDIEAEEKHPCPELVPQ